MSDRTRERLRVVARPLDGPSDLDAIVDAVGDARLVLLGEATHGTSEFYRWRAELTQRLVQDHGFAFVAVEGDWPECYRVNRYVKAMPDAGADADEVLDAFSRWPTWLWANREVADFVEWLRDANHRTGNHGAALRVGFYGLDVYSLWESLAALMAYVERVDPNAARLARRAARSFDPYYDDAQSYARATALVPTFCEDDVVSLLRALRVNAPAYAADGAEGVFNAEQNALIVRDAERYYRTMVRGGATSWSVRDRHMVETLARLLDYHGPHAKAIVWEHNMHVGDARFTDMARYGMVNVGQLVREVYGQYPSVTGGAMLIGCGTHRGSVIAAREWNAPMERMRVPPARRDSWEDVLHETLHGDAVLLFDGSDDGGIPDLDLPMEHRAIGVVYDPHSERWGNYVPAIVPRRYDAFVFIDASTAVAPLHMPAILAEVPETYPSGM
jgi:erythromycin esterase